MEKFLNWSGFILAIISMVFSLVEKDYTESMAWGIVLLMYFRDLIGPNRQLIT